MRTTLRLWIVKETEKAYLFSKLPLEKADSVTDMVWVPRSMVERITKFRETPGTFRECEVDIQEWFAEKKGLL